jgi:hypothetical protein
MTRQNPFDQEFEGAKRGEEDKTERLKIQSVDELPDQLPSVLIDRLLRKEEILLMGGQAKRWKSWARLDLLYCVANGMPWLSFDTIQAKALHLDLELHAASVRNRFELIRDSYGQGDFSNLRVASLRGQRFSSNDIDGLASQITPGEFDLFSLDPIYRLLGGKNESDPGVVTQLLNQFLALGFSIQAAICLMQHFTKGNAAEKEAQDRFSGTAIWSRFPDALMTFTDHEDENCFGVEFTLRDFAPVEPIGVRWEFPRFRLDASIDPEKLKQPRGGRPKLSTAQRLAALIHADEEISYTDLLRRAVKVFEMKERTFNRRLAEAKREGLIYLSPINGLYALTSKYVSQNQNAA